MPRAKPSPHEWAGASIVPVLRFPKNAATREAVATLVRLAAVKPGTEASEALLTAVHEALELHAARATTTRVRTSAHTSTDGRWKRSTRKVLAAIAGETLKPDVV